MTPKAVGRAMDRARRLMKSRTIDRTEFAVFDAVVWGTGRLPFQDAVDASYTVICAAVGASRAVVVRSIGRLVELGLLAKRKRSALVPWFRGQRWVQLANCYRVLPAPDCEFTGEPGCREAGISQAVGELGRALNGMRDRLRPRLPVRSVAQQIAILTGTG